LKKKKTDIIGRVWGFFKQIGITINNINDTYDSAMSLEGDLETLIPSLKDVFAEKIKEVKGIIINFIGLGPFNALYYGKKVLDLAKLVYRAFTEKNVKERLRNWGKLIGTGIEFFTTKPTDQLLEAFNSVFHAKAKERKKKLKKIKKKLYKK